MKPEGEFREELNQLFSKAKSLYTELSDDGKDKVNLAENDVVTEVDREMTQLIQKFFQAREEEFTVQSEELNKEELNTESVKADYTVIFDEIDGTSNMRRGRGVFGPIIGIAEGEDPKFEDIVACGFLDLKHGEVFEAYQGRGAYHGYLNSEKRSSIDSSGREELSGEELPFGIIDQAMLGKASEIAENAWRYPCKDHGCQGIHFGWISDGTVDFFITGGKSFMPEKDGNTAEEVGPMYLLVKESGGAVTDWKGQDIGDRLIAMKEKKNHNIIAAASQELAEEVAEQIIPEDY